MKKLFVLISLGCILLAGKSKAAGPDFPNITTNIINTLADSLATNVTFISNVTYSVVQNISTNQTVLTSVEQFLETNNTFHTFLNTFITTNGFVLLGSNYIDILYINGLEESTNRWAGPTNIVDFHILSQSYTTFTPMSITGWTNIEPSYQGSVILNITNAASTNVTMYMLASVTSDDGARSYIVTNGTLRVFSLRHNPQGYTNNVSRTFF